MLERARAVLRLLEGEELVRGGELRVTGRDATRGRGVGEEAAGAGAARATPQLGLFPAGPHPLETRLRAIDPNRMTPLEALDTLARLVAEATAGGAHPAGGAGLEGGEGAGPGGKPRGTKA